MAEDGLTCFVVGTNGDSLDTFVYCRYFAENLHHYSVMEDGEKVYEGLSYDTYCYRHDKEAMERMEKGEIPEGFLKLISDKELRVIHKDVIEKTKIKLDPLNFFELCAFVNAIVRERYFILLKPTIKDTLEELKDVTKITFTSENGKSTETTNSTLIDYLLKSAKESPKEEGYETFKMVKGDELIDNIYLQSRFVFYLARFLQEYFPDAVRRANCCMVSLPEQRFILRMLSYFGLAPDGITLTDSRFRQLISFFKNNPLNDTLGKFPDIGYVPIDFVKYQDWRKKDWYKHPIQPFEVGEIISFKDI